MLNCLGEVLGQGAARFGDKVALITDDRQLTYTQLDDLSSRFAGGLCARGIKPGDRVTLYAANTWQWIVSYYGVLKAGAVINPVNIMLTSSEIEFVLKDCGARALVTSVDKAALLSDVQRETQLEHMIVFGGKEPAGSTSFDDLTGAKAIAPVASDALSLSTIAYTSGTTGHPKGAMHSHRNVIVNSEMTALVHVRTEHDIVLTALPCPHVYGNVVMNSVLLHGGTLVLHGSFDAATVLDSIERHRATMFEGVPTMYFYMLGDPDLGNRDLSSLTRCTVGGQTMPVAKMKEVEERFHCPLIELWGMTEMAGLGSTHPLFGENRHGSIGIPLPYTQLRIAAVDDADTTLPPSEVGELMAAGPHVMMSYYGNEEETREALEADGWLHTGDLAYMDPDGYVYIVDRKKDLILTAGYNIYPAEIERVVAAHPAVAMVAVGAIPDEAKGELAKAYVVLKAGANATDQDIIAFCRKDLAAYKLPRAVQFVDDLPKTSTGKIMRRKLADLDNGG